MADVLLGQAYYLRFDPKLWEAQQPYAPLGTLYAASYLRQRGHGAAIAKVLHDKARVILPSMRPAKSDNHV